jgi:hypothetical protein
MHNAQAPLGGSDGCCRQLFCVALLCCRAVGESRFTEFPVAISMAPCSLLPQQNQSRWFAQASSSPTTTSSPVAVLRFRFCQSESTQKRPLLGAGHTINLGLRACPADPCYDLYKLQKPWCKSNSCGLGGCSFFVST